MTYVTHFMMSSSSLNLMQSTPLGIMHRISNNSGEPVMWS